MEGRGGRREEGRGSRGQGEGRERAGKRGRGGEERAGKRGGEREGQTQQKAGSSEVDQQSLHKPGSYLQPNRPWGPRKTSWTFVTFLPEETLLAARPWLTVGSLQERMGRG